MKKLALLISLVIVITGCGKQMDAEFLPYIEAFKAEAKKRNRPLTPFGYEIAVGIAFARNADDLEKKQGAYCNAIKGQITIDREEWENQEPYMREAIIFHELGHCVLGRDHVDFPAQSLMVQFVTGQFTYLNHREEFLDELFGIH